MILRSSITSAWYLLLMKPIALPLAICSSPSRQPFPSAVFFGFTGTPIQEENQKKHNTTSSVFGNELHRYSIADGIRDKNVLGFDPYKVVTYKDKDLRKAVALLKAKANTESEAFADPKKKKFITTT